MPIINISHTQTMEPSAKNELVKKVTDAYVAATGANPANVWVAISEIKKDDFGIAGVTLSHR